MIKDIMMSEDNSAMEIFIVLAISIFALLIFSYVVGYYSLEEWWEALDLGWENIKTIIIKFLYE